MTLSLDVCLCQSKGIAYRARYVSIHMMQKQAVIQVLLYMHTAYIYTHSTQSIYIYIHAHIIVHVHIDIYVLEYVQAVIQIRRPHRPYTILHVGSCKSDEKGGSRTPGLYKGLYAGYHYVVIWAL